MSLILTDNFKNKIFNQNFEPVYKVEILDIDDGFGNISDINTQITAPWPMAWAAINKNRNIGTAIPVHPKKKAMATSDKEMI